MAQADNWRATYLPPGMLALTLMAGSGALIFNSLPLYVGYAAAHFNLSDTQAGLFGSSFLAGFALLALSALRWLHRVDWRTAGLTAMTAGLLLLGALGLVQGFSLVLAVSLALGAASGMVQVIGNSWVDAAHEPDPLFGVKGIIDLGVATLALWGMSLVYAGEAGLPALLTVYAAVFMLSLLAATQLKPTQLAPPQAPVRGTPAGWGALAVLALHSVVMVGFWGFAEHLARDIGLAPGYAARLFSVALIAGIGGAWLASVLGHRGRPGQFLPWLYLATAILVLPLALWQSSAVYIPVIIAFQFLWIALNVLQMAFVADIDDHNGLVAVAGVAVTAGGALGPASAGIVRDLGGQDALFTALIAVTLICMLISLRLDKQHRGITA